MATMTKCIKVKIIKPIDSDWNELGKILRDLRYNSSKVLNLTIQRSYEWHNYKLAEKEKTGTYPVDKDVFGCSFQGDIYRQASKRFNIFNTGNLSQTTQTGFKKFKDSTADIMRLKTSIPSYKLNCPIYLHNNSYSISQVEDGSFVLAVGLISKKYATENSIGHTQFKMLLDVNDNSSMTILNRLISGTYKSGSAQILYSEKKNKWFASFSYSFQGKEEIKSTNIMGVDLGIKYPVYIAFSDSLHRYKIEGGEIEQFRKQIERRKNELLRQGKYCANGRKGHGRNTRNAPIEFATDRVANFRNTTNHKYSAYVVEVAIKHNVSMIQMEKLEGINERSAFLKNWSYYDLQQKIEYKAKTAGIEVYYIDPYKTSQRCSKCGYIDKENREDQSTFICKFCGFETNADYNAAKNISVLDIENIIKQQCKVLGIQDSRVK